MAQFPLRISTKLRYIEVIFSVTSDNHKGILKEKLSWNLKFLLCKQEKKSSVKVSQGASVYFKTIPISLLLILLKLPWETVLTDFSVLIWKLAEPSKKTLIFSPDAEKSWEASYNTSLRWTSSASGCQCCFRLIKLLAAWGWFGF